MDIIADIKRTFKTGGILVQLIIINIAIFFLVNVIDIIVKLSITQSGIAFSIVNWFAVPSDINSLLFHPWTIISYMFLHQELMHILFNMLWLYWFGKLFIYFIGEKKLLSVYIYGGLTGAAIFILMFNIVPIFAPFVGSPMLGASAAIMAIVMAVSFYQPDYEINLMFIGPVKLKYVALVTIALDLLYVFSSNSGGHLAHLGGALFGYLYSREYKKGHDLSIGFNRFFGKIINIFSPDKKLKVVYRSGNVPRDDMDYNKLRKDNEVLLNKILDKISKHGYGSLTKDEKEFLFKQSKK